MEGGVSEYFSRHCTLFPISLQWYIFVRKKNANTLVRHCATHGQPELNCNAVERGNAGAGASIDHAIRAEHDEAMYPEDGRADEHRSVAVPFERPPPGTHTHIHRVPYRFCCMGGMNRHRLVVLRSSTLED